MKQETEITGKSYGGLWLNQKKGENQPTLTGSVNLDGKLFRVAVFKNQDRTNRRPDYNMVLQINDFETADKIEKPELD